MAEFKMTSTDGKCVLSSCYKTWRDFMRFIFKVEANSVEANSVQNYKQFKPIWSLSHNNMGWTLYECKLIHDYIDYIAPILLSDNVIKDTYFDLVNFLFYCIETNQQAIHSMTR